MAPFAMKIDLARFSGVSEKRELCFAVIGAGMSGLLSAIRLRQAGYEQVTIYEKGDSIGGTWRENTYPGIACDVPSHLYRYSFAPNPEWSTRFAPGAEIRAYFENAAREFGVYDRIRFGEEIARCAFEDGRWHLETKNGLTDEADFVIAATGILHHPKQPDIAGLDDFAGDCFHSAQWDHDVSIEGKRVGVIGTGATGVQIVSHIADRASRLSVFQRTAQWVMYQENKPYRDADRDAFRDDPQRMQELYKEMSKRHIDNFSDAVVDADSAGMQVLEAACRESLEMGVENPVLRERLRPDYRAACKRLVMSPDFYRVMQQPQVELVTEAITRAEAGGVRTRDDRLHELDVLVLATGFHVDRFFRPMQLVGRNGLHIDDVWAERPVIYHSISIPEFPNFFMVNGPQSPIGNFSLVEIAELQFEYILQLIELVRSGRCREVSARDDAMRRLEAARIEAAQKTIWVTGCRSWYLDDRGVPITWPWTFERFRQEMEKPRLEDYALIG